MTDYWWLLPVGIGVGLFGTLIGAGGGFMLVPLLLLLYPHENPEIITSISLAVVFFNAASGSWAYSRMRRINYRAALLFSVTMVPGTIFGALSTSSVPRRTFDAAFGTLMLAAAIYLALRTPGRGGDTADLRERQQQCDEATVGGSADRPRIGLGMWISAGVGYLSGLLGIGGGIIHVPLLVQLVRFPVHVATATSHMILTIMALAATIVHISTGTFSHGYRRTIALAIGVVIGAQAGAYLSNRIRGVWIVRALAGALALVGIRVLLLAWTPLGV